MNLAPGTTGPIITFVVVFVGACLWGFDGWCRTLMDIEAVRAFVLSNAFAPTVIGIAIVLGAPGAAILFHPARLTGRNVPERGE